MQGYQGGRCVLADVAWQVWDALFLFGYKKKVDGGISESLHIIPRVIVNVISDGITVTMEGK
ncbi:hypothetical protein E2C01_092529 [Portunus trituberculatus]|uniref:Uncharacterized protein n=1 Tax=Portunus trituberculatus TaxID=210409 RepID=A0A5B7JRL8_PORTR|nr:hypothetical protein [Portunus trituberculatus]